MANTDIVRKKINTVLDSHSGLENADIINTISRFCVTSISSNKRTLKHEIEKRDLLNNKAILSSYGKVKDELDKIYKSISTLNVAVDNMAFRLDESKRKTSHLIDQTTKLRDDQKKTQKKFTWIKALTKHFEISSEDIETLHGPSKEISINSNFFVVLEHIEKLYDDCKILVKCGYETSSLDIMEIIGLHQEAAIERLYRWTIHACRNIDSPNNVLVPRAMSKLQNRQVLFVNIIDEYCTARKSTVVRLFIDGLTRGTESGSKPMEFFANDPKRYIGDILTCVYQIIPIEKENLCLLLKECNNIDVDSYISQALVCILESICPPLKVRTELILKADKDPQVLWVITNLINYYNHTFKEIISTGQLIDTLGELYNKSEEVFILALDSKIQKELSHGVKAPPSDLTPSSIVTDLVSFLRELLSVTNVADHSRDTNIKIIVSHIIDPLLQAINETACHLSSTDMSVYLLNCIYHIQCTLSLYPNMGDHNERLQAQSEAQLDTLTSEQASCLVANLNMGPIYTILQEQVDGPLSAVPGMDVSTLKTFLNKFDMFLASPDVYVLPQLNLLLSHNHKKAIKKRSFEVIFAIYKQLYHAIYDPQNKYEEPHTIVRRSPEEVYKLLI